MNTELTRLGVPLDIQAFFKISGEISFDYGNTREIYLDGRHYVPATNNIWFAGDRTAKQVLISYSVLEIMAFLTLNKRRYTNFQHLALVAIGNRLYPGQLDWLRINFKGRRFTLLFGEDLIGRITDVKVAAGLKHIPLRILHINGKVLLCRDNQVEVFEEEEVTLNQFKTVFAIRGRIATRKSLLASTFLEQLRTAVISNDGAPVNRK